MFRVNWDNILRIFRDISPNRKLSKVYCHSLMFTYDSRKLHKYHLDLGIREILKMMFDYSWFKHFIGDIYFSREAE